MMPERNMMSAETTLRSLLAQYIHEADSLDTAFSESTTDLFSLGMDSMGAFALLDDLAGKGITIEFTELVLASANFDEIGTCIRPILTQPAHDTT